MASFGVGVKARLENKRGNVSKKVIDGSRYALYVDNRLRESPKNRIIKARNRKKENRVWFVLILLKREIAKKTKAKTYKNLKSVEAKAEKPNTWKICRMQSKQTTKQKTRLLFLVFFSV